MRQFEACIVPAQPFKLTISETIELLPSVDGGQEMADPKLSVWKIFNSSLHLSVIISDAQLPDTLRVVHTNLAQASQFWTFWYQNLYKEGSAHETEGRVPPPHRTTRKTVSVDENTTPYFLPTSVDRERGKIWHKKKTRTRSKLKQSGEVERFVVVGWTGYWWVLGWLG